MKILLPDPNYLYNLFDPLGPMNIILKYIDIVTYHHILPYIYLCNQWQLIKTFRW